jgi:hypothetical protein
MEDQTDRPALDAATMIVAISAACAAPDFEPIGHTVIHVQKAQRVRTGLQIGGSRQATGSSAEENLRSTGVC